MAVTRVHPRHLRADPGHPLPRPPHRQPQSGHSGPGGAGSGIEGARTAGQDQHQRSLRAPGARGPVQPRDPAHRLRPETGVKIDIDEEGNVSIYSSDQDAIDRAKEIIAGLVREAKVDEVYHAKVVRIEKFGAFVNLFDKTDALVHISEMAWTRTNNVEDLVAIGDEVDVKVIKVDEKGRVDASMKALLPRPPKPEHDEKGEKSERPHRPRHHKDHKPKKEFTHKPKDSE